MNMRVFTGLFFLLLFLTSCRAIVYKAAGIKDIKEFDQKEYEKFAAELTGPYQGTKYSFAVSDSGMQNYVLLYTDTFKNNAAQPIQLLYFKDQKLVSFHANCYAPGKNLRTLNWRFDGRFDKYIPKSAVDISSEHITLAALLKNFNLDEQLVNEPEIIVVLWSRMLDKRITDLNEVVIENLLAHNKGEFPPIIYLNTDQFFISQN